MEMKRSDFQQLVDQELKPHLLDLGFKEIILKNCMCPEVLYQKGRLWFGASWDYRDQYLEISLGHLYWFKDVMPRVIIIGSYESYSSELARILKRNDWKLEEIVKGIRKTINDAIAKYEERYEEVLKSNIDPQKGKRVKEFYTHLDKESTDEELEK
jgi:hypothetical protein